MSKYNYKAWPWKAIIPAASVSAAALLIRIIYLYQAAKSPTFSVPIIDSAIYDYIARKIINDGVMDDRFFWHSFFYPFFLSRIYYFTGGSIIAAKIIQAVLGSVTSVLVYVLGSKLFGRKNGTIAGLIYALYGPAVFFETRLLATGWACFWSVILILLLLKAMQPNKRRLYLVTGLCAGASILTRATFVPFVVAAGIWLIIQWYKAKLGPKIIVANTALLALGIAATLVPVLMLSYSQTERLSVLPEAGPLNLYIGNNPNTSQTRAIRPGHKWTQLTTLPKQHGAQNRKQAEEHFMQQVKDYARTQPGGLLKNLAAKTGEFFTSREIPRNTDIYRETKDSSLLSVLVFKIGRFGFPFGLLFPLSLIGFWLYRRRVTWPVVLFLILYPLAIIMVFPAARYRVPIVPLLAPLAAAGLLGIFNFIKEAKSLKAACSIIFAAIAAMLISIAGPYPLEDYDFEAETNYCIGYHLWDNKDFDQAQIHLSKAVSLMPDYADAHNILGRTLYEKSQYQQARQHLETAIELNPRSYSGHYYLGKVMLELGENSVALEEFEKAAELAGQAGNIRFAATAKQAAENCQKQTLQDR